MKLVRGLTLTVAALLVSVAVAQDKKPAKLDPKQLIGNWSVTEGKKAGEKSPADGLKGAVIITKDTITIKGDDNMVFEFTYKADAATDPASIDMEITKPEGFKGAKAKGIIWTDGETAKLCYHPAMGDRPKKFESTKDNGNHLYALKKEAKKKDK